MNESAADILPKALFDRFARIAYERAGIKLRPGKESLVAARVARRMRALELTDLAAYADLLDTDRSSREMIAFLDAISTNVTSFFREERHFDYIAEHVTARAKRGSTRMRFWCAGCSSGEEPYSLAMVLAETLGSHVDWLILASDISVGVLETAERGRYPARAIEPIPPALRAAYMTKEGHGDDATWQITPALRKRVVFRRINLAEPPFPMPGPLDIILCRNVMIYFDDVVRSGIIRECERLLAPGGALITSHTETLASLDIGLRCRAPSIYERGER